MGNFWEQPEQVRLGAIKGVQRQLPPEDRARYIPAKVVDNVLMGGPDHYRDALAVAPVVDLTHDFFDSRSPRQEHSLQAATHKYAYAENAVARWAIDEGRTRAAKQRGADSRPDLVRDAKQRVADALQDTWLIKLMTEILGYAGRCQNKQWPLTQWAADKAEHLGVAALITDQAGIVRDIAIVCDTIRRVAPRLYSEKVIGAMDAGLAANPASSDAPLTPGSGLEDGRTITDRAAACMHGLAAYSHCRQCEGAPEQNTATLLGDEVIRHFTHDDGCSYAAAVTRACTDLGLPVPARSDAERLGRTYIQETLGLTSIEARSVSAQQARDELRGCWRI